MLAVADAAGTAPDDDTDTGVAETDYIDAVTDGAPAGYNSAAVPKRRFVFADRNDAVYSTDKSVVAPTDVAIPFDDTAGVADNYLSICR